MVNKLESAINFISNKASIDSSKNYLNDLSKFVGDLLQVDYLLVNKYLEEDSSIAETVTVYTKDGFAPNMTYSLAGTPCQNVFSEQFCSYKSGVQQLFPEDELLVQMEIESYVGAPLWDAKNQVIGIIVAMNKGKMDDNKDIELVLKTVSSVAGIELERRIFKNQLKISEDRFNLLLESSEDMITMHAPDGTYLYYNGPSCYAITPKDIVGKTPEELFDKKASDTLSKTFKNVVQTGNSETIEVLLDWLGEKRWFSEYIYPIKNEKGEVIELVKVCRDIHQRKLAEQDLDVHNKELFQRKKELQASNDELNKKNEEFFALLKSNQQQNQKLKELYNTLNHAQKLSNIGSWQWNMATDEAEWSDQMYNIYGVSKGEFYPSNENVTKTVLEEDFHKVQQGVGALLNNQTFEPFEFRIRRPSGEIRTVYIVALQKGEAGSEEENMVIGVTQDITEQKHTEQTLRNFAHIAAISSDLIFISDLNYRFLAANKSYLDAFGLKEQDVIGKTMSEIMGVDDEFIKANIDPLVKKCLEGEMVSYQRWHEFPKMGKRYMDVKYSYFTESETGTVGIVVDSRDITLRKQAQDRIQKSLEEKELLLRELYHRTKNNMQVISSMLSIKSIYAKNEEIKEVLSETKSKILGMALVHEKLYQANDLSRIDLKNYLEDLIELLKNNLMLSRNDITIETSLENVESNIDIAIPCGLIVNEVFTNSIKHAFAPNEKGIIKIRLEKDADDVITIAIHDNGKGLPKNFDIDKSKSYGLQSTALLSKHQLGGTVQLINDHGTSFSLKFKEGMNKDRI